MGIICTLPPTGFQTSVFTRKIMAQPTPCLTTSSYFIFASIMALYEGTLHSTKYTIGRTLGTFLGSYIDEFNELHQQLRHSKELTMIINVCAEKIIKIRDEYFESTKNILSHYPLEDESSVRDILSSGDFMESLYPEHYNRRLESKVIITGMVGFTSQWKHPFDTTNTFLRPVATGGKTINTPMMHQILTTNHYENENYQYLELEFKDSEFVFYIILPRSDDYVCPDKYDTLITSMSNAKPTSVELYIPRIAHHHHHTPIPSIKATEPYESLFQDMNFDGMFDCQIPINSFDIIYDVSVVINETGVDCYKKYPPNPALELDDSDIKEKHNILFCCNRMFSYGIVHKPTTTIVITRNIY